jgi:hypothetical protein
LVDRSQGPRRQPGRAVDITARIERGQILGSLISDRPDPAFRLEPGKTSAERRR